MQMPGLSFSSSSLSTWFCLWSILLFVIPANVNGQSHNATFQWAIDNTLTGLWVNGVRLIDSDTSDIYQFQNIHTQNITLTGNGWRRTTHQQHTDSFIRSLIHSLFHVISRDD